MAMFRKNKVKEKENEVDITSLNHILKTGKKLINIGYFMAFLICMSIMKK